MPRKNTLVLNVSGIGDFVDSTPALAALRRRRPLDRLVLAVAEKTLPLARTCPHVDEVIGMPTRPGRGVPRLVDLPRWLFEVLSWRKKFDMVISLYGVSSNLGSHFTRQLLAWIGAPVSVGRSTGAEAFSFTHALPEAETPRDLLESCLKLVSLVPRDRQTPTDVRALDTEESCCGRPELWIPEDAVKEVEAWLARQLQFQDLEGPYVVVALGGDRPSRRESSARAERWLTLLQEELGVRPIVWGTLRDPGVPLGSELLYADARGQWDLVRSAGLISRADVVITTQSAAQHMVSVWDIPTVVLAGPADPEKHRPHLSESPLRLLQREVPCAPCYYHDCPLPAGEYKKCLTGIAPADVLQAFREVMELMEQKVEQRPAKPSHSR